MASLPEGSAPSSAATDLLFSGALRLATTAAVHVTGRLMSSTETEIVVDAQVSNHGPILATLSVSGHAVHYIAVGQRRFMKASMQARDALGLDRRTTVAYGGSWVEVGSNVAAVDFSTVLNVRLGWSITEIAGPPEFVPDGDVVQVGSYAARQVCAGDLRVWLTSNDPVRILRLCGKLGQPREHDIDVDLELSEMTDSQIVQMYTELCSDHVPAVFEAIGSTHPGTISGVTTLDPCGPSGCLATVKLSNTVGIAAGTNGSAVPMTFAARIAMSLDGALIKTSSLSVKMSPNASATVRSFLSYVIPPSSKPTTHRVEVTTTVVRESDLDVVVRDLVADLRSIRNYSGYVRGS